MSSIPTPLVPVLLEQMRREAEHHLAILEVRPLPVEKPVEDQGETVDRMAIVIEHMPFELGRPRRLKKKDPRRSQEKGITTWSMSVNFQAKPGADLSFRPDVLFNLRDGGRRMSRVPADARETMNRLARAMALRILGEDLGLLWRDGEGFRHGRNQIPVSVGFLTPSSDSTLGRTPKENGDLRCSEKIS